MPVKRCSSKRDSPSRVALSADAVLDQFEELFTPIPKPRYGGLVDVPFVVQGNSMPAIARPAAELSPDDVVIPAEAVEIVSDMLGTERPVNHKLSIELLGEANSKAENERA
jgi:hypothetical protein